MKTGQANESELSATTGTGYRVEGNLISRGKAVSVDVRTMGHVHPDEKKFS